MGEAGSRKVCETFSKLTGREIARPGDPNKGEPDFILTDGTGVEVTTTYDSQGMARWTHRGGINELSPLVVNPDHSASEFLGRILQQKFGKRYRAVDAVELVIHDRTAMLSEEQIQALPNGLRIPTAGPFHAVWILTSSMCHAVQLFP